MLDVLHEAGFKASGPDFSLVADGRTYSPATMRQTGRATYELDGTRVRVIDERQDDGSVSRVIEAHGVRHVTEVCLFDHELQPQPDIHNHRWFDHWDMQQSTAVFLRAPDRGAFVCYANPFGRLETTGGRVRLTYRPAMDVAEPFRSDPLVVGRYERAGRELRRELLKGRDIVQGIEPGYGKLLGPHPAVLDEGEARAVREGVAARVPWTPARARVSHWDWGENLFRLDASKPETQDVYERLFTLLEEMGVEIVLLAPDPRPDIDGHHEGPWQKIMWLGMGLDVGHGTWRPGNEPPGLTQLLKAARKRELGVVAYSNPQYLWLRNEEWKVEPDEPLRSADYRWTCLAHPEAREWLIDTYRRFRDAYDLKGFSLDFVYWARCHATGHGHEPGEDSQYAQWYGYREVLRALNDRDDSWVEGLIGSQQLLPWGADGLTHPHPVLGDNQPQWVPAWPDLSQYRAQANYQRRVGWWCRNFAFTPAYKVPGQANHQANRLHFFPTERGWDWDGARYNLLSSIASAPSTTVVCFLPCWDTDEWKGMRNRDAAFFRRWLDFAREHARVLSRLEDLFEEPRPGAVDGTIARDDDGTGLLFLTNPGFEAHTVAVPLGEEFVLRELHPEEGRLWQSEVTVEPHEVAVLAIERTPDAKPLLLGVAGELDDTGLLTKATGVPGSESRATVLGAPRTSLTVRFASDGIQPTLGPWSTPKGTQVEPKALTGEVKLKTRWAPGPRLPALLASVAPPSPPEGDERLQPWSDPSRLRLFVELLDPAAVELKAWVDGEEADIHRAYYGTYEDVKDERNLQNNLLGHYLDLTDRLRAAPDLTRPWTIEIEAGPFWEGQLRGVHVAHLPHRRTNEFEVL